MENIKKQIEKILIEDMHKGKVYIYIIDLGLSDQLISDLYAGGKGAVRISDIPMEVIEKVPELKEKVSLAISTFDGVSTDMLSHPTKTEFKQIKVKEPITSPIVSNNLDEALKTFFKALGEINEITSDSAPYLETPLIENFIDRYYVAGYNQRITSLIEDAKKRGESGPDDEWIDEEWGIFFGLRKKRMEQANNAKGQPEKSQNN